MELTNLRGDKELMHVSNCARCADILDCYVNLNIVSLQTLKMYYKILGPHITFPLITLNKYDFRVDLRMDIWQQFCCFQCRHLHHILENLSENVNRSICHVNLMSTGKESCNLC